MSTPSDLLSQLLPLANGDALAERELRRRVFRFLRDFEARGLRLCAGQGELWDAREAALTELKAVARKVERVFATWLLFEGSPQEGTEHVGPDDVGGLLSFPSLRFSAFRPKKGRTCMMVEAFRLRDLVPYLAMYLLTTEDVTVGRCPAPQRQHWKEECGRLFIAGGHVGRPSNTCSRPCAVRLKNKRVHEQQREDLKRAAAARKRIGKEKRR